MNGSPWDVAARMVSLLGSVLLFVGCGPSGAEYTTAPVRGKIVADGQSVTSGTIRFQPIAKEDAGGGRLGKPAAGEVQSDGTFELSTYEPGDGAVVGKHRVMYLPKVVGAETYEDQPEPSPYAGLVPKEQEVEVKPGSNELTIELVPRK